MKTDAELEVIKQKYLALAKSGELTKMLADTITEELLNLQDEE